MSIRIHPTAERDADMIDCNNCGASIQMDQAQEQGWRNVEEEDFDICPDCHARIVRIGRDVINKLFDNLTPAPLA